ncbi:MAG: methyltransferase domain-containing protein [Rhodocyclaceae bacterium]
MQRHLRALAGLSVCDLPCGAGLFSQRLVEAGMQVTSVDIEAVEPFRADPARRILANANERLPFEDGQFDVMVSIEGIEHLENPTYFLRECARVVKPGGWIFLSTPNVDSLRSRRYAFVYGHHKFFHPKADGSKDSGHLLPVNMAFVRHAVGKIGLEVVDVGVNEIRGRTLVKEWLRPILTRKLPDFLKGEIPFYGEVIIYAMRKPA